MEQIPTKTLKPFSWNFTSI